jgi:glycosyltransferase involved in cell wall biosynthesis/2-polyprenyl-3-methyl-5-hydroxy-6-metoxy-1,4-benzoquinol methylase
MKIKVAVISHSSHHGGAETAFLNLLRILIKGCGYDVLAIFPDSKGPLLNEAVRIGARTEVCEMSRMLGDPVRSCIANSNGSYKKMQTIFTEQSVNLVITNTLSTFEGALAAAAENLPHIWSIHEIIERSPEFSIGATANGTFSRWAAELSDHLLFCSKAARDENFRFLSKEVPATILPPYLTETTPARPSFSVANSKEIKLFFIGAATERKNPMFAAEVLKALLMRGRRAKLFIIGASIDKTGVLDKLIRRRGIQGKVIYLGNFRDPYKCFTGLSINFISAKCEPFGLTIPESLARNIPVIAPNIDGPAELIFPDNLYSTDDVASCVRIIERIADSYDKSMAQATENYNEISWKFEFDNQTALVKSAIVGAVNENREKLIPPVFGNCFFSMALDNNVLSRKEICESISKITQFQMGVIEAQISTECKHVGQAVMQDVEKFDVIPFHHSKEMENLYEKGNGFCIELAAAHDHHSRIKIAGFIILRLLTERQILGRVPTILAVGDGIGVDSIRLASAGFDVDYMDFEASVTSRVATENFRKFSERANENHGKITVVDAKQVEGKKYDVLISLEVIEHVTDPHGFLSFLSQHLIPGGLAFISDCFSGIDDCFPTHLARNEKLSGLLPLMASFSGLHLDSYSKAPLYKPFVFRKDDSCYRDASRDALISKEMLSVIVNEQTKIVRTNNGRLDNIVHDFRLLINKLHRIFYKLMLTKIY